MIGDLDCAARTYGDRGYRYVHFEAGAIGHRSISPLKRLDWVQPASVLSTMMRCTVISTCYPNKDRSYTILRSVIRFPTRASRHRMSRRKTHGRHNRAWRQPFRCTRSIAGSKHCASTDSTLVHHSDWFDNAAFARKMANQHEGVSRGSGMGGECSGRQ